MCGAAQRMALCRRREKQLRGQSRLNAEQNRNANRSSVQSLTLENDNVCLWLFGDLSFYVGMELTTQPKQARLCPEAHLSP